jgi:hypothetical protein
MDSNQATTPDGGAKRRRFGSPLLIAGVAFLLLLGAGFAASISINNDTPAEFGQGVEEIAACDGTATAVGTPGVIVSLGSQADVLLGQFTVSNVFLTDIDAQCEGKWLKLGLYDAAGDVLDEIVFLMDSTDLNSASAPFRAAALAGNSTQVDCSGAAFTGADFPDGAAPVLGQDCWQSGDATEYGLGASIPADDVNYVTIESSDNPPSAI